MHRVTAFWKSLPPIIENMFCRADAAEVDSVERPEVMRCLPPLAGMHVLDLAAGIGRFTTEFATLARQVTAVDFVPQFLEQNQKNNQKAHNITYLCSDAREVEFPVGHFDLVFVSGLFLYLEDDELEKLAHKILTWLKPGGYLFFRETCSPNARTKEGPYSHQRSIRYYHQLMDPLFECIHTGSIQTFIDRYADPFRCYWLYQKSTSSKSRKNSRMDRVVRRPNNTG